MRFKDFLNESSQHAELFNMAFDRMGWEKKGKSFYDQDLGMTAKLDKNMVHLFDKSGKKLSSSKFSEYDDLIELIKGL
jgi:hypothetical protein